MTRYTSDDYDLLQKLWLMLGDKAVREAMPTYHLDWFRDSQALADLSERIRREIIEDPDHP